MPLLFHRSVQPKSSIYMCLSIFLKSFLWLHMKLDLSARYSCFCRCVEDRYQMPKFLGHFGPPNESKFRFLTILLTSFIGINISLALYAHWRYFQKCVQYGPQRPNFCAILEPFQRPSERDHQAVLCKACWIHTLLVLRAYWGYV